MLIREKKGLTIKERIDRFVDDPVSFGNSTLFMKYKFFFANLGKDSNASVVFA